MPRIELRISEDGSTVALHAFYAAGDVMASGPHGLIVDRAHTCLVTGRSRIEWPDGTSEVFTPESDVAEINEAQRDQAHREIAVTDLETCCWKIPRTAVALSTTGLHEAVQLGILRAEPGQVLGSADAEDDS